MIEFTIKTLDSNNHHFSVDDEITVQQLKEKVRDTLGIEINLQRLIFCGRVLQDDKKLSEYDVNGKVVHLVQRAPPSPESRHAAGSTNAHNNTNTEGNNMSQQQFRRLMAVAGYPGILDDQQTLSFSSTVSRLELIRRLITEIKTSLAALRAHVDGEEGSSSSSTSGGTAAENTENEPSTSAANEEMDQQDENTEETTEAGRTHRIPRRAIRAFRARHSRPRHLAQLLEELDQLNEQFAPYRAKYIKLLGANSGTEVPQYSEEERRREQRTVDMVSDLMHSFAHAFHTVSDINFKVGALPQLRLSSEASSLRHPIPMQAHINVVQSNRRPQQPFSSATATSGTGASNTTTTQPSTVTTENQNQGGQPQAGVHTGAGRNTTQPTVNINIQPDPITYQVEIETRMPIAFALENALLNGLQNNQQQQQNAQNQPQNQSQTGQQNNAGPQNQTGQQNTQGQANRRQVLFDFENLFRGLGQTGGLGGVEVVMSMEEIPPGGSAPGSGNAGSGTNNTSETNNSQATNPPTGMPQNEGGVYLGSMPWGGPPSADLLQNIVTSVIRQGLVPGVEGVAFHGPIVTQTQNQPQEQTSESQGQSQVQGNQEQANQINQQRQPNLHLRRATTTTRAQALSLNNFVYDRFLHCDSPHARRRLQRRREQHEQQLAAQEQQRTQRTEAQNIEALRERNSNLTQLNIQTLLQLLNSSPSQESWLNAFLVTIARHLFLSEFTNTGEPSFVPNEFRPLRNHLRNYLQNLLTLSGNTDNDNAFETVSDYLMETHHDFINRMSSITPIRPNIDLNASIRAFIRSRLPVTIALVMSDSLGESFAARFYATFSRLFTDLCALITFCCRDGADGMRAIYTAYLEEMTQGFNQNVRQLLTTLANENLNFIINNVPSQSDNIQQYIRRICPETSSEAQEVSPMEVSPILVSAPDEPMQTSPPATPSVHQDSTDANAMDDMRAMAGTCPVHSSGSSHRTATITSASQSATLINNLFSGSRSTPRASKPETARAAQKSTSDTQANTRAGEASSIPILQHWGEEWVPVFTRDQELQHSEPPEPYSDAYLSGMPSRKRRCVRQSAPPTTLEAFMNESVREVSDRATADTGAMRRAFREHVRSMARARAAASADYDPQRYASVERFLNIASRSKKQDQPKGEDGQVDSAK